MPFPRGTILKQLPHLSLPRDLVHVGTDVHLTDDKFGMTLPWPCLGGGGRELPVEWDCEASSATV